MNKKTFLVKKFCYIVFVMYILALMKITLFKYTGIFALFEKIISGNLDGFHSLNLIPFQTFQEFGTMILNGNFSRGFINLMGNILIFAPLGWFLPLLFHRYRKWKSVLFTGFLTSCFLECCQYFLYLGSADIDDVILNTSGVILGFLCFQWLKNKTQNKPAFRYRATLLLSIAGFIAAFFVAANYFGLMFGFQQGEKPDTAALEEFENMQTTPTKEQETESIQIESNEGKESEDTEADSSPQQEFDMLGDIISLEENTLTVNQVIEVDENTALSSNDNRNVKTICLLPSTAYFQMDVRDKEGKKTEIKNAAAEDLKPEQLIEIKGYTDGTDFFATEITIHNYLFS